MAGKQKKLTCTFYIGNVQVDSLPPEYLDKMAQRIGETMSVYYTAHPEEYKKIKGANK
ncbi:MAG: hypothetical protein U0K87_01980 [Ruminococcus sp.]|nr:hypothetical protein [Ruminococcus sp.]